MTPTPMIKAAEIWTPDADGYLLEFDDGLYGASVEFETVSRTLVFGRGEGLPGRAWEDGAPILLPSLDGERFRRAKYAKKAGLSSGIALPYFAAGRIAAVAVLFIAEGDDASAALWQRSDAPHRVESYGTTMPRPPSTDAWGGIVDDTTIALPLSSLAGDDHLLLMQSTGRPARGASRWTLDDASDEAVRIAGSDDAVDETMLMEAFASGVPRIATAAPAIALPRVEGGRTTEVFVLGL